MAMMCIVMRITDSKLLLTHASNSPTPGFFSFLFLVLHIPTSLPRDNLSNSDLDLDL